MAAQAVGAWPPCPQTAQYLRFVGLDHEPDGRQHVNIYLEPPLPGWAFSKTKCNTLCCKVLPCQKSTSI